MRRTSVNHEFVEFIPSELQEGVLYVSVQYATAVHQCACGCGNKVVTPISPVDWQLFLLQEGNVKRVIINSILPTGERSLALLGKRTLKRRLRDDLVRDFSPASCNGLTIRTHKRSFKIVMHCRRLYILTVRSFSRWKSRIVSQLAIDSRCKA